jgi:uncharacterized protein (DUF427 family)
LSLEFDGMLWDYYGQIRPPFAESVEPGQESVWDYPRPPRIARDSREVLVRIDGIEIARTSHAVRVLETASPPGFYLPPEDVRLDRLSTTNVRSFCEWKGEAVYFDLLARQGVIRRVGWSYPTPSPDFAEIAGYISFYPGRIECFVDAQRVRPQPGAFYGGWLTAEIAGPVKGEPGSESW